MESKMIERLAREVLAAMPSDRSGNIVLTSEDMLKMVLRKAHATGTVRGRVAHVESPLPSVMEITLEFDNQYGKISSQGKADAIHVWVISTDGKKTRIHESKMTAGFYNWDNTKSWWLDSMNPSRENPAKMEGIINDMVGDAATFLKGLLQKQAHAVPRTTLDRALLLNDSLGLGIDRKALETLFRELDR